MPGGCDKVGDDWVERPQVFDWLSRIHAERISGDPLRLTWDGASGALEIDSAGAGGAAHEIYVPAASADTFAVSCAGEIVPGLTRDASTGLISVACDGRVVVTP